MKNLETTKENTMTDIATKKRYISNINKLVPGRKTHCGEFGTIRCDQHADNWESDHRIFVTSKAKSIANSGKWTFNGLRKAILAAG